MLTLLVPTGADEAAAGPRCPRCERDVAPEDLEDTALDELRLIDPHFDRYAHRAVSGYAPPRRMAWPNGSRSRQSSLGRCSPAAS